MKDHSKSKHHIIGKSEQENFNVFEQENIISIQDTTHKAIHSIFHMENKPKEQLRILIDIMSPVLSRRTLEELYHTLSRRDIDFYKSYLVKHKKDVHN